MFNDEWWLRSLARNKAIAVIRTSEMELALAMSEAVAAGGIKLIEITWNSDRPDECISKLRENLPHCAIGAGTILDVTQLELAIAAGAQFIFCPHFDHHLSDTARDRYNIPLVPGVLSPTEIVTAWQARVSVVKIFPIQAVGGADYLKSLQGPLSQTHYIPSGGVTIHNARAFIEAGAIAVAISGNLFPQHLVEAHNWQAITQRTKTLLDFLHK
jgi:2-dehydro-3-deoxyphosphogluconate aldolase / (4S)-4-hydroxy-2-oxoglutarate aldolase